MGVMDERTVDKAVDSSVSGAPDTGPQSAPEAAPPHGGELAVEPRELGGEGREQRRLQLAEQLRAGGVTGGVLPVPERRA